MENGSVSHSRPVRVKKRLRLQTGGQDFPKNFHAPAVDFVGNLLRNIADGDRHAAWMGKAARGHPAAYLTVEGDRFVADDVGILGLEDEGEEPKRAARKLLFQSRLIADEARLLL